MLPSSTLSEGQTLGWTVPALLILLYIGLIRFPNLVLHACLGFPLHGFRNLTIVSLLAGLSALVRLLAPQTIVLIIIWTILVILHLPVCLLLVTAWISQTALECRRQLERKVYIMGALVLLLPHRNPIQDC